MRKLLLSTAKALCDGMVQGKPIPELLSYFTEHEAVAIEHGHPSLAPWLGREFIGHKEIAEYFQTVADSLDCEDLEYSDYFVDEENLRVGVKGTAKWTWKKTGKSWKETFSYVLDFAEGQTEGSDGQGGGVRELKVRKYAVWADSGALYLAIKGDPNELLL